MGEGRAALVLIPLEFPSIQNAGSIAEQAGCSSLKENASCIAELDGEVLASGNIVDGVDGGKGTPSLGA